MVLDFSLIMFKKILITTMFIAAVTFTPQAVYAKTVCTQEYGQPVVCKEEEQVLAVSHETVNTAAGDVNLFIVGSIFIAASGVLLYFSKRKTSSFING